MNEGRAGGTQKTRKDGRRDALRVALIGVLSAALYAAVYAAQRAMFRNGLRAEFGGVLVRGEPADVTRLLLQGSLYCGATLGLFALYVWLLVLCRRGLLADARDARARRLALLFPVLFNVGLLLCYPYGSIDALTYVAHGHLGNLPDANPYSTAVAEVGRMGFGRELAPFGWLPVHGPSPYGPLWTHVEIAAYWAAGGSVLGALFSMKALVVAASLGSAACVWKILGRVRPEDRLLGTLVYLWNPVIVFEFAAEGHNDALMILCALLSLALTVAARPALSVVASTLGVLVKYVSVVFVPAQLVYLWRTRELRRGAPRLALGLLVGGLLGLGLAVALYGPLWVGMSTFDGVRAQGRPFVSPIPSGWLYGFLLRAHPPEQAAQLTLGILGAAFALFILFASWRVRDAAGLLRACVGVALFYVLVASTGYWPWYAALPLAFMALVPRGIFLPAALVLALCSRLVAPVNNLWVNGLLEPQLAFGIKTTVGVTVPLSVLLFLLLWNLSRRVEVAKSRET